ncbi:MAG: hypothetical protein WCK39_01520 [Methanomassiliicoccales archaeon]
MSRSRRLPSRHRDKGRFLKKDREGVASTIGTMMALLIFLTLFTMFTNSYLPLWMKDNERQHMTSVMDEMGTLKGKIEIQESMVSISGQSSLPMFQTFQLGAAGVPVFVAPTVGVLSLMNNTQCSMTVTYAPKSTWANTSLWTQPVGGCVQLWAPNRYFVQQWITYENNGILTKQTDGQTMNVAPGVSFNGALSTMSVGISTVNLIAANTSVTGTGSGGVAFSTLYVDTDEIPLSNSAVFITMKTYNGLAFWNYFNDTIHSMDQSFVKVGTWHYASANFDMSMPLIAGSDTRNLFIIVKNAVSLNSNVAYVNAALS